MDVVKFQPMNEFSFTPNPDSTVLKFQQLVDAVIDAINRKALQEGDALPSVNQLIKESSMSRDTVFKAYAELKKRGIVEAIPNKGYFVASNQQRVFLFLDTFKAYKEVLYSSFKESLPEDIVVDVNFHHYNINVFESIIQNSVGKYNTYIVMNFDHPDVSRIIKKIPADRLLVIDWKINAGSEHSRVYQDFGDSVTQCLEEGQHLLQKYEEIVCVYPEYTYHPYDSVEAIERFCREKGLRFSVVKEVKKLEMTVGRAYLVFEDIDLGSLLKQVRSKKFQLGRDIGILSYNDTPMKEFVMGGITVISTDFVKMGEAAAGFVTGDEKLDRVIPTHLVIRESL
ncbi:GntR family transcriptional regulator [Prolixibacter sp. NT017]|nr:GntR family transcriptional regulator [Prolixibacter sp. NT017]